MYYSSLLFVLLLFTLSYQTRKSRIDCIQGAQKVVCTLRVAIIYEKRYLKKKSILVLFSSSRNFRIKGVFNLHLLEFTFIYQFYSRKTVLVESIFWNSVGLFAFMSFHNHFKQFWYCVLHKMRGIFCPYLFWDTAKLYLNW